MKSIPVALLVPRGYTLMPLIFATMKVLFVCLGNICRSPLAEAIFVHKVVQKGYEGHLQADSCGTGNYNIGNSPDPRAERNARKNGIHMQHIARQLMPSDFDEFDRILVMDAQNLRAAQSLGHRRNHSKIELIRTFDPLGIGDVPDPYLWRRQRLPGGF